MKENYTPYREFRFSIYAVGGREGIVKSVERERAREEKESLNFATERHKMTVTRNKGQFSS